MLHRMQYRVVLLSISLVGPLLLIIYQSRSMSWQVKTNYTPLIDETIKNGTMISNNSYLIDLVRNNFLIRSSPTHQTASSSNSTSYSQLSQDKLVDELLKGRRHGFFIEAGAHDGQFFSNTLFFERERNWTGLLIEPNPKLFEVLQSRHRNAFLSKSCLSTNGYAKEMTITFADHLSEHAFPPNTSVVTTRGVVQCFPLLTYLLALNISHVDYFSLDIEGGEFDVLKQIDFKRIQIDVFTIEYAIEYQRSPASLDNLKRIDELLTGTGLYRQVKTISDLDVVFLRKSL